MALRGMFSVRSSSTAAQAQRQESTLRIFLEELRLEAEAEPGYAASGLLFKSVTVGQNTNVPRDDPSVSE